MPVMQPDEYGYHQAIETFASEAEPAFEGPEMQRLGFHCSTAPLVRYVL